MSSLQEAIECLLARQLTTASLRDSENSKATILPVYYKYKREIRKRALKIKLKFSLHNINNFDYVAFIPV